MSRSEDYLDGLLNLVENGKVPGSSWEDEILADEAQERVTLKEKPRRKKGPDDDFFDSFENELLLGENSDDFLLQFEKELEDELGGGVAKKVSADTAGEKKTDDPFGDSGAFGSDDAFGGADTFSDGDLFSGGVSGGMDAFSGGENMDTDAFGGLGDFSGGDLSGDMDTDAFGGPGDLFGAPDEAGEEDAGPDVSFGGEIPDGDLFGSSGDSAEGDLFAAPDDFSAGDASGPEEADRGDTAGEEQPEDSFLDNLDDIVNGVKEKMMEADAPDEEGAAETAVDALDDAADSSGFLSAFGEEMKASPLDADTGTEDFPPLDDGFPGGDAGFADNGLDDFDSLGMEEGMLGEGPDPEESGGKKSRKKKKGSDGDKMSFGQKLSRLFFGADEDEDGTVPVPGAADPGFGELGDENLELLDEMNSNARQAPDPKAEEAEKKRKKKEEKEKKAKEKKAKKEQKAKEKKEKEAKKPPKEKKPKKPKPPKVPDNSPRLPKVPVFLIFVMAGSFLALVLIGTNLFGYSSSFDEAEQEYSVGNYEEAYRRVSGLEVNEKDQDAVEKYRIMAVAAGQYRAYQSFMESGIYDMALDSLIRTVGRCEKYREDAQNYGCGGELEQVKGQASGALSSFGITPEQALELYDEGSRGDYSEELYRILMKAGFLEQENR